MSNTIRIRGDDFEVEIQTQSEITPGLMSRIEKQVNAVVNEHVYHDIYGRITSINMSLYMLERATSPNAKKQYDLLKTQITDLTHMIELIMG